jgi:hypothetical protein
VTLVHDGMETLWHLWCTHHMWNMLPLSMNALETKTRIAWPCTGHVRCDAASRNAALPSAIGVHMVESEAV